MGVITGIASAAALGLMSVPGVVRLGGSGVRAIGAMRAARAARRATSASSAGHVLGGTVRAARVGSVTGRFAV